MSGRRARIAAVVAALVSLAGEEPARASNEPAPLRATDRAAVAVAWNATGAPRTTAVSTTQVAPELRAAFRLGPATVLDADAALAMTSYRFGDDRRGGVTRASNVFAGVRHTLFGPATSDPDAPFALVLGVHAGAPLVTVPSGGITASAAAEHADRTALGAAGPRGAWLWSRNAVPLVGFVRASHESRLVRLWLDVEPGILVSVNRDPSRLALVVSATAALRADIVEPYLSASAFAATRAIDRRDFAQTGAAAGARYDLGAVFGFAEARLSLDGPAGAADRYATFWGATLGVGARF